MSDSVCCRIQNFFGCPWTFRCRTPLQIHNISSFQLYSPWSQARLEIVHHIKAEPNLVFNSSQGQQGATFGFTFSLIVCVLVNFAVSIRNIFSDWRTDSIYGVIFTFIVVDDCKKKNHLIPHGRAPIKRCW